MDPSQFNQTTLGGTVRGAPASEQYRGRTKWSFMLEHQRPINGGSESWAILVDVWFDRLFPIVSQLADGDEVVVIGDLRPMGGQQNQRRPVLKINADKILGDSARPQARRVLDFADRLPEASSSREDNGGI